MQSETEGRRESRLDAAVWPVAWLLAASAALGVFHVLWTLLRA